MEKHLLSIILPVYNAENFIDKTLSYIKNSEYKNIEIICIDDGSTDRSVEICNRNAIQDGRIHVISQKNSGISAARNKGIEISKGDYITFCDHDDIIKRDFYKRMMGKIIEFDCDMVTEGYANLYIVHNKEKIINLRCEKEMLLNSDEIKENLVELYKNRILSHIWNCIYKSELIKKYNIQFDSSANAVGEDLIFNLDIYNKLNSIFIGTEIGYIHVFHNNNASNKYRKNMFATFNSINGRLLKMADEYNLTNYKINLLNELIFKNILVYIVNELNNKIKLKYKVKFVSDIKANNKFKKNMIKEWSLLNRILLFLYKFMPSAVFCLFMTGVKFFQNKADFLFRKIYYKVGKTQ